MAENERILVPGRDYSRWPRLKVGHARRLAAGLHYDIEMWRVSNAPETRTEYSEDRREVTFFADIPNSPPLYEWSLAFGDIVHAYRSSLDALTWALAHLDGSAPAKPQNVAFPLTTSREKFERLAKSTLSSVPKFAFDRLQRVQPYHAERIDDAVGMILHELDIQDKHRSSIEFRILSNDLTDSPIRRTSGGTDLPSEFDEIEFDFHARNTPIKHGDRIVTYRLRRPATEMRGSGLPMTLAIEQGRKLRDIFELLAQIDFQIEGIFSMVNFGEQPRRS